MGSDGEREREREKEQHRPTNRDIRKVSIRMFYFRKSPKVLKRAVSVCACAHVCMCET